VARRRSELRADRTQGGERHAAPAAVEIVQYGLLYALARDRYSERDRASKELLQATEVHLRVLAPADYYAPYKLRWLEHDLDAGLRALASERFGQPHLASFSFEAFPGGFCWPSAVSGVVDQLRCRRRVWSPDPAVLVADVLLGAAPPPSIDTLPPVREIAQGLDNPLSPTAAFAEKLKRHLSSWARENGLVGHVESGRGRPWVLAAKQRGRNLYREEWWRHLEGYEHRWVQALNSSQCFAVNLFANLAADPSAANRFVRRILPDREIIHTDQVRVAFEHSPKGVPERLGERGQPTQIDVFFTVFRGDLVYGAIGVEVKLSEREFGSCRGWTGVRDAVPVNPERERCLDGPRVFESPSQQCFMAQREGRKYWSAMMMAGTSFDRDRLAAQDRCPFRHGLYSRLGTVSSGPLQPGPSDVRFSSPPQASRFGFRNSPTAPFTSASAQAARSGFSLTVRE
jgi:hypothetical protein